MQNGSPSRKPCPERSEGSAFGKVKALSQHKSKNQKRKTIGDDKQ
jgi:hypothetical protein